MREKRQNIHGQAAAYRYWFYYSENAPVLWRRAGR